MPVTRRGPVDPLVLFEVQLDFGQRSVFRLRHAVDDEQHAQETETGVHEKRAARPDQRVHRAGQARDQPDGYPVGGDRHARSHGLELFKREKIRFRSTAAIIDVPPYPPPSFRDLNRL